MIVINDKQYIYNDGFSVDDAFHLALGDDSQNYYLASLNGKIILSSVWKETAVKDGDEVQFISVISGG